MSLQIYGDTGVKWGKPQVCMTSGRWEHLKQIAGRQIQKRTARHTNKYRNWGPYTRFRREGTFHGDRRLTRRVWIKIMTLVSGTLHGQPCRLLTNGPSTRITFCLRFYSFNRSLSCVKSCHLQVALWFVNQTEAQAKSCPCRGPLITKPPEGWQPLGRICDWSMGGKHKQKVARVECPLLTCPVQGQPFACACRPLANREAAPKVDNLQAARWLVNGRQAWAKGCPCRGPVTLNEERLYVK